MSEPTKTAREIAEDLLTRSGRGVTTGDFEMFGDCFVLPMQMETFEGRRAISTMPELEKVFNDVRAHYDRIGTTEMVRHIVDAEFRNASTIVSTHQCRLVAGTELVQQPFDVLSVIEQADGVWRIRHSQYSIVDSAEHNIALTGPSAVLQDGS